MHIHTVVLINVSNVCCLQDVGASQEEGIGLYDVARPENMSPECNTADTDDAPPPGYDTICKSTCQLNMKLYH